MYLTKNPNVILPFCPKQFRQLSCTKHFGILPNDNAKSNQRMAFKLSIALVTICSLSLGEDLAGFSAELSAIFRTERGLNKQNKGISV